jgi:ComF family protein
MASNGLIRKLGRRERWPELVRKGGMLLQLARSGLYRPRCRICGLDLVRPEEEVICGECRVKIRPAAENQCRVCGKFLPEGNDRCGDCLLKPPPYLRHASYAAYEKTLREVIILYKYGEVEPLKHLLAPLYLETIRERLPGAFDTVIPVPADRGRRHGFQPVRAMGCILARRLGIEFWPRILRKTRRTPPQVGLSQAQRKTNLDGAFALAAGKKVAGKSILLIDDVTTTGSTIRQCAAVLQRNGARVTALTLAQSRP